MLLLRSTRESRAIGLMRFPLACLIVLLHTGVNCGPENFIWYFPNIICAPIVQLAVPSFFFISGYLFFIGKNQFGLAEYKTAMRKKAKSLLMPYLIWNIVAYLSSVALSYYTTRSMGDVMPWELHRIFWANGDGIVTTSYLGYQYPALVSPAAGVLWFMRDLMVMMVCSIVAYRVVKLLKWWLFLVLFILNAFKIGIPFPGFSLAAVSFFYMGAFFSIHDIDVFAWLKKVWQKCAYLVWPILYVTQMLLKSFDIKIGNWFNLICLIGGIVFVFVVAYDLADKHDKTILKIRKWGETSFFIYTFANTLFIWAINKEPSYLLDSIPYIGPTLCYLFQFTIRIAESVAVYYLMKRYSPRLLSILIGRRI